MLDHNQLGASKFADRLRPSSSRHLARVAAFKSSLTGTFLTPLYPYFKSSWKARLLMKCLKPQFRDYIARCSGQVSTFMENVCNYCFNTDVK